MKKFDLFFPLTKVDVEQRLVYGVLAHEIADGAKEIMDYETSKPEFEKWSAAMEKASDGKSLGNVRAMHGKVAAGKLEQITFNDAEKMVEGCAKIVDDNEWEKVLEGVYTGFSIGGSYIKSWKDPANPLLKRYTAGPAEVSIVDKPCMPTATFKMIKADGVEEERHFKSVDSAEPEQVWKAKDGKTFEKKADAIAHNETLTPAVLEKSEAEQLLEKLNAALDKVEGKATLKKSLWDVSRCANILQDLSWLGECLSSEAFWEGDGSTAPDELKGIVSTLGAFLKKLVEEEVNELVGSAEKMAATDLVKLEALAPFHELIKAAADEKKKKKKDAEGEETDEGDEDAEGDMDKAAGGDLKKVAQERDALQKQLGDLTPMLQKALERIEKLESQPQTPKGSVRAVTKQEDTALSGAAGELQKTLETGALSPEQARNGLYAALQEAHDKGASSTK